MTSTSSPESGLLVVDKPAGLTSHDVVARVRRLARTRRVGHAGTLDPAATGVLLLGVNRATRLLGHLALSEKSYDATVRLGATTTTDDAEGEVLSTASVQRLDEAAVRAAVPAFTGRIEQVPSAVSAIKVAGERAYKRVRAGETVELPARPVTIHELGVHAVSEIDGFLDVDLSVRCSSGTYVRAIARDLGAALGVGGHLTALRRTAVGAVTLAEATPLDVMETAGTVELVPMASAVERFFPTATVDEAGARAVGYGRPLELTLPTEGRVMRKDAAMAEDRAVAEDRAMEPWPVALLGPDGAFLALYEQHGSVARPVAVFV